MKVTKVNSVSVFENPHEVEAKRIYENEKAGVIFMALRPGQSQKTYNPPLMFSSTFSKEGELWK